MASKRILSRLIAGICGVLLLTHAAPGNADLRAAKKEGTVSWYTSLFNTDAQKICRFFNKKKLGVTCNLIRLGSGKLYRRYLEENKAGILGADVIHTSNISHFINLKGKKHLRAYRPKGTEKFDPAFQTEDATWTILRSFAFVPHYNVNKVKGSAVPKSWKDILDPRFKNRLVHPHPASSGATVTAMIGLVKLFGWDYYKKMAELKPLIVRSASATPGIVARGEAHMAVGGASYTVFSFIQRGEPIRMLIPKEGVPIINAANALLRKAPHPNAAKVFNDFLFSAEIQQFLANLGLYVGHPDVKYPKGLPPLKTLKRINIPSMEVKEKTKEIRRKFREIMGV